MLPRAEVIKNEIYEICKNSPDVKIGQKFSGVMYNDELRDKPCRCIGKREDFERYFVTEDELCYFTASDGCGEKDGYLYAVNIYGQLRFEKPTDRNGLRDFIKNFKRPESVVGAVRRHTETIAAGKYIKALEKYEAE